VSLVASTADRGLDSTTESEEPRRRRRLLLLAELGHLRGVDVLKRAPAGSVERRHRRRHLAERGRLTVVDGTARQRAATPPAARPHHLADEYALQLGR